MKNVYQHNRTLAQSYKQDLQEQLRRQIVAEEFPAPSQSDPQKFYLEFKNRIQPFLAKTTLRHQEEAAVSDNPHLILLKHTAMVDIAIETSLSAAVWFFNRIHGSDLKIEETPLAIVARGGYGREETFFCSNIDIYVVSKPPQPRQEPDPIREIIKHFEYLFLHQEIFSTTKVSGHWELGVRDKELETRPIATLCELMETRWVTGNALAYDELKNLTRSATLLRKEEIQAHFAESKWLYELQNTVFRQEPNLKDELRRLRWALALACFKHSLDTTNSFECLHELYCKEILSAPAYKNTQNALTFIARLRLLLHCRQKGAQRDILSYEVREKIAEAMGYGLKEFYRQYFYNTVYPLKRNSRNLFWDSMTQDATPTKPLSDSFAVNTQNQIFCLGDPDALFAEKPELIFKIHAWVAEKGWHVSYPIIRSIERNADQTCPIFFSQAKKNQVQGFFKKIVQGKFFARALRLLHEFDLLGHYYIPEFKALCGLLQDIYVHQFPTDVHILSALDELNKLELQKDADPFLAGLYHSLKDKTTLKLAVLLHDIGKGAKKTGENEELVGAKMIPGILENLGFRDKPRRTENVAFLVQKHLMMRDLMLLDPEEEDTYEMVWDLVDYDNERLKMLILLTYADRGGTKMKMSALQIEQLKLFYQQTLYQKKRESVAQHVKLEFLKMIRLPLEMQDHLEVYNQFIKSENQFAAEVFFKPNQPCELVVCTRDNKGLLFKMATVLAYNQLNILEADIHTLDDKVFDVFKFQGSAGPIDYSLFFDIRKKVKEDLRRIYIAGEALAQVYSGKTPPTRNESGEIREAKIKLSIIGRAIKLESADVLGTFMMETKMFSKLGMEIQRAVLHTQHGSASNVFYLRPQDVESIIQNQDTFKEKMRENLERLHRGEPILLEEADWKSSAPPMTKKPKPSKPSAPVRASR